MVLNKARDNRRRRELTRIKNGGVGIRGRPPNGGMIDRYTGLISDDAWEFAQAMYKFKSTTGIRFPTASETLMVLKSLGYKKC